ncbi:DUF445 domain-containing protein [Sporichthya sp.]|uniref:DUF445 domain-containing protein n=1 Tax=Sporichthya sp. TaxID=65475 RepID=UPI0018353AE2|nr:DUF445 domain-containing protein [Sporichthya sp.]MBA3742301.1 DUF445 domain-containing protein [Sporichthya sp.]
MHGELPTWAIYVSMPLIAAVIGYVTKLVAVEMMMRPLEFRGIKPFLGWQGVIPRFAPRMANIATDLMLSRLLTTRELFDRIDGREMALRLQVPMKATIDEMTREIMSRHQPLVWEAMPEVGRRAVVWAVQRQAPKMVERLVDDLKRDPESVIDLRAVAVDALTRDKALLVSLIRRIGKNEFNFIIRVGAPFGFALGLLQAGVWAATHNTWIVPIFGGLIGFFSDWAALQLIFRPVKPKRFGRLFSWQGVFHRRRVQVIEDYATVLGGEILTPANLIDAMLTGPQADRLFALVAKEVDMAVNAQVGPAKPLVVLAVGGRRYQALRQEIVASAVTRMRGSIDDVGAYAMEALDVQGVIITKMTAMTDEEYENLLRPAFKQDEWKLIAVGGVLGFLIGELQVHLLLT